MYIVCSSLLLAVDGDIMGLEKVVGVYNPCGEGDGIFVSHGKVVTVSPDWLLPLFNV